MPKIAFENSSELQDFLNKSDVHPTVGTLGGRYFTNNNHETISMNDIVYTFQKFSTEFSTEEIKQLKNKITSLDTDSEKEVTENLKDHGFKKFCHTVKQFFGNLFFNRTEVLKEIKSIADNNLQLVMQTVGPLLKNNLFKPPLPSGCQVLYEPVDGKNCDEIRCVQQTLQGIEGKYNQLTVYYSTTKDFGSMNKRELNQLIQNSVNKRSMEEEKK